MTEYEKDLELMTMECDGCSFASSFEGDWKDCIAEAKEEGWRIVKVGEEWRHYCEDCKYDT